MSPKKRRSGGGVVGGPIPSTISAEAYNLYYKINHGSKERYPSEGEGSRRRIEGTSVVVGGTLVVIFHSCAFPDFLSPPPLRLSGRVNEHVREGKSRKFQDVAP